MNNKNLHPFSILLLSLILLFMTVHWVNLSKKESFMDQLSISLEPVRNLLSPDAVLSFQSNFEESKKLELYFQTAFAMAPCVLSQEPKDILLIIEDPALPPLVIFPTDTLLSYKERDLKYTLVTIQP